MSRDAETRERQFRRDLVTAGALAASRARKLLERQCSNDMAASREHDFTAAALLNAAASAVSAAGFEGAQEPTQFTRDDIRGGIGAGKEPGWKW